MYCGSEQGRVGKSLQNVSDYGGSEIWQGMHKCRILDGGGILGHDFGKMGSIDDIRAMIERWYNRYAEMGDEMAVQMFMDDLESVYPYITLLYQRGVINFEEYDEFHRYCERLVGKLMDMAGIEDIDRSFR